MTKPPTTKRAVEAAIAGIVLAALEVVLVRETDLIARFQAEGLGVLWSGMTFLHVFLLAMAHGCLFTALVTIGPHVVVKMAPREARPGDTLWLAWKLSRPQPAFFQRVRNVRFRLTVSEGWIEPAVSDDEESRGRSETLLRTSMAVVDAAPDGSSGLMKTQLPDDAGIFTRKRDNGTIYWNVSARGEVRLWPNIRDHLNVAIVRAKEGEPTPRLPD